MVYKK